MELLVKLTDNTHIDPAKDLRCWKRGDVVAIMEDGHQWGLEEGPPKFFVIKMPGITKDKAASLVTQDMETIEVVTQVPLEEFKNKPEFQARTDGKFNYITVTQMKARRQVSVDVDAVVAKINQGTVTGSVANADVASVTLSLNDLNTVQKPRIGAVPV